MNIFIVFFTFAVWAWSFPLGKWAGDMGSILLVTSIRQLLAAGILFAFISISKRNLKLPTFSQLKGLLILGILGFYITNYLELLIHWVFLFSTVICADSESISCFTSLVRLATVLCFLIV